MPFAGVAELDRRARARWRATPLGFSAVTCNSFGPPRAGTSSTSNSRPFPCIVVEYGAFTALRAGAALTSSAVVASTATRNTTSSATLMRNRRAVTTRSSKSRSASAAPGPTGSGSRVSVFARRAARRPTPKRWRTRVAADRGDEHDDGDERELHEQQPTVGRALERAERADLAPALVHAGAGEHDHRAERERSRTARPRARAPTGRRDAAPRRPSRRDHRTRARTRRGARGRPAIAPAIWMPLRAWPA